MADREQEMGGILSRNDFKKNENQPDYTGDCKINGVELRMAGWIRQSKGRKFLSVKFSAPLPQTDLPVDDAGFKPSVPAEAAVDDIPFRAEELPTFTELRQTNRA